MQRRVPDLALAERLIGYHPRHTLDEILLDVIDHHSGNNGVKDPQPRAHSMLANNG